MRINGLEALIITARFKMQVHFHFCFELERTLFFSSYLGYFVSYLRIEHHFNSILACFSQYISVTVNRYKSKDTLLVWLSDLGGKQRI